MVGPLESLWQRLRALYRLDRRLTTPRAGIGTTTPSHVPFSRFGLARQGGGRLAHAPGRPRGWRPRRRSAKQMECAAGAHLDHRSAGPDQVVRVKDQPISTA